MSPCLDYDLIEMDDYLNDTPSPRVRRSRIRIMTIVGAATILIIITILDTTSDTKSRSTGRGSRPETAPEYRLDSTPSTPEPRQLISTSPFHEKNQRLEEPASATLRGRINPNASTRGLASQPYRIEYAWVQSSLSASITETPDIIPYEYEPNRPPDGTTTAHNQYTIHVKRQGEYAITLTHPSTLNAIRFYQTTGTTKEVNLKVVDAVHVSRSLIDCNQTLSTNIGRPIRLLNKNDIEVTLMGPFFLPLHINVDDGGMIKTRAITINGEHVSDSDRQRGLIQVLAADTGRPVEGATVRTLTWRSGCKIEETHKTNSAGQIEFSTSKSRSTYAGIFHPLFATRCVSVAESSSDSPQRVHLLRRNSLGGTLVNEAGDGLRGFTIYLFEFGRYAPRMYGRTNDQGHFQLGDLRSAWYTTRKMEPPLVIAATSQELMLPAYIQVTAEDLHDGQGTFTINTSDHVTHLRIECIIRGVGTPVQSSMIKAIPMIDGVPQATLDRGSHFRTDQHGMCSLNLPRTIDWLITSSHAEYGESIITLTKGSLINHAIIEHEIPSLHLSIRIIDTEGHPLPSADIQVFETPEVPQTTRRTVRTNALGEAIVPVEEMRPYLIDLNPSEEFIPIRPLPMTVHPTSKLHTIIVRRVTSRALSIIMNGSEVDRASVLWIKRSGPETIMKREFLWFPQLRSIPVPLANDGESPISLMIVTPKGNPETIDGPEKLNGETVVRLESGPRVSFESDVPYDRIKLELRRIMNLDQDIGMMGISIEVRSPSPEDPIVIPNMCPGEWMLTGYESGKIVSQDRFTVTTQPEQTIRIK